MRQPRILDVLDAATEIAAAHPEVAAWWYAPPRRLRLQGELRGGAQEAPGLEVVVETVEGAPADCAAIAAELSGRLPGNPLTVRLHRAAAEERRLFRLVSEPSHGQRRAGG